MRQGLPAAGPEPAAAVAIGGTFPQPAVVLFGDKRPEALLRRPPRNRVQRATAAQRIVVFLTQIPRRVPPRTARDAADARPGGCRHPGGCGFVRERGRWAASAAGNPAPGPPPRPAPASAPPAARWRISRPRRSRRAAARTARSAPGRPATALAGTRGAADAGTTAPMAADPPDRDCRCGRVCGRSDRTTPRCARARSAGRHSRERRARGRPSAARPGCPRWSRRSSCSRRHSGI